MSSATASRQVAHLVYMLPWLLLSVVIAGAIPAKISTASDDHDLENLGSFGGFSLEHQNLRDGRFLRPNRIADGHLNGIRAPDKQQVDDYELNTIDETEREAFETDKTSMRVKAVLTKSEYNKLMKKFDYGKIPKKGITYQYKPSSYLDLPRSFIRYDEILATKNTDKFILDEELSTDPELPTESPRQGSPEEDTLRDLVIHLMEPDLLLKVPVSAWSSGKNQPRSSIKFSEVEVLDGARRPDNARVLSLSVLDPVLSQIEVLGSQDGPFRLNSPLSPDTRISLDQVPINQLLQKSSSQHQLQTAETKLNNTDENHGSVDHKLENESFEDKQKGSSLLDSTGARKASPFETKEPLASVTLQNENSSGEEAMEVDLAGSDEKQDDLKSDKTNPSVEQGRDLANASKGSGSSGITRQGQTADDLPEDPASSRPRRALNLFRFSGESGNKFLGGRPGGPLPPPSNYTPTYGIRNATIDPERKRQRFNQLVMNMDVSPDSVLTPLLIPAARSLDSMANLMDYTMPTLPPLIAPSDLPMLFTIPPIEEWFPAINVSASPFNWTLPKADKLTSLPGLNLTSLPGLNLSLLPGLNLSSLPGLNMTSLPGLDLSSLPGLNFTSLPSMDLTQLRNTVNPTIPGLPNIENVFASSLSGLSNNSGTLDIFAELRNKFLTLDTPTNPNDSAGDRLNLPNQTDFIKKMSTNYQTKMNISNDSQVQSLLANIGSIFTTSTLPSTEIFPIIVVPSEQPTSPTGVRNLFGSSDELLPNLFNINSTLLTTIPLNANISSLFSLTDAFSPVNSFANKTQEVTNALSSLFPDMSLTIKNKLQNFLNSSTPTGTPNIFSLISRAAENATSAGAANISDIFNVFTQAEETTTTNPFNLSNIFGQDDIAATTTLSDFLSLFTQTPELTTSNPFNVSNIFLQSTEETTTTFPNIFGITSQPTTPPTPSFWNLTNVFSGTQETTTPNPWNLFSNLTNVFPGTQETTTRNPWNLFSNLTDVFPGTQETPTPNPWNLFSQSTETISQNPWDLTKLFPAKKQATVTTSRGLVNPFSLSTEATTQNPWNFNNAFSQSTETTPRNPWNLFNAFTQTVAATTASNPFNLQPEMSTSSPLDAFNVFSSPPEVDTRSSLDLFNAFFKPTETVTQNPWNLFNAFTQTTAATTPNPWNFLNLFGASTTTAASPIQPLSSFGGIGVTSNQDMPNNIDDITEFFRRSGMAANKGNPVVKEPNTNALFIPRSYLPPPNSESASHDSIIPSASLALNPFVTNIRQTSNPVQVLPIISESALPSVSDDANLMSIMTSVLGNPSRLPNVPNYLQGLSMDTILAMVPNLNPDLVSSFLPIIKNQLNVTSSTAAPIPPSTEVRGNIENLTVDDDNEIENLSNVEPSPLDTFKQKFLNFFAIPNNKSASEERAMTSGFMTPPPLFPILGDNRRSDISSWTPLLGHNANDDDSTFKHNANDPLNIQPAKPVLVFSVNDDEEAPPTSKSALTVNFNKIVRNQPGKLTTTTGFRSPHFQNPFGRSLEETFNTPWTPLPVSLPNIPPEMIENMMTSSGVSNDLLENVFRAMRSADFTASSSNTYPSNNSGLPTLPPFVFPTFPPIEIAPPTTTTTTQQSLFRYDPTTTTTTPPPFTLFPPLVLPTTSAPATQNKSADDDFTRFLQEQATKMSEFFNQMSDFSVEAVTHLKDAGTVVDSLGSAASRTIHALVDIAQVLQPVTNMITRKIQMVETDRTKNQQQQQQQQQPRPRDSTFYVRNV